MSNFCDNRLARSYFTADELAVDRAASGAMWLDDNEPGWEQRIDRDTLDMASLKNCIFGQLYGDWTARPDDELGWEMGFDIASINSPGDIVDYEHLDRAWQSILSARKL